MVDRKNRVRKRYKRRERKEQEHGSFAKVEAGEITQQYLTF